MTLAVLAPLREDDEDELTYQDLLEDGSELIHAVTVLLEGVRCGWVDMGEAADMLEAAHEQMSDDVFYLCGRGLEGRLLTNRAHNDFEAQNPDFKGFYSVELEARAFPRP